MSPDSDPRLARLEREILRLRGANRRILRAMGLVALALLALVAMGQTRWGFSPAQDVISAGQFRVLDWRGQVRAVIGTDIDGQIVLHMVNPDDGTTYTEAAEELTDRLRLRIQPPTAP